ncbi:glycosyltransferase [Mucilaginibacter sp. Bleaf8]|uniref:glycosyltransferase n=1 Tax=Mucilaginibacter sp. Bleaf8 TaxID=2834430 RepID=UPI001BCE75BE|nr:glycosyltransferase [Mucilaginibacter sp. Bleaf8]MBS7562844.1 glycosyltransferase [Mucilaginibacter sp. Bleaf8]
MALKNLKKLKIAFFVGSFPCISETFILNQIVYLVKQGHDVTIFADSSDNKPVHPQVVSCNLLSKVVYPYKAKTKLKKIIEVASLFLKSEEKKALLKTFDFKKFGKSALNLSVFYKYYNYTNYTEFDLIHAHFGPYGNLIMDIKELGLFKDIPLIVSFHGYDINPLYIETYKESYKRLFGCATYITSNSNFTSKLLEAANCPASKLIKVRESLDTSFIKPDRTVFKTGEEVNILFCGRFIEFKAPELVIEIANILINVKTHQNIKFHMIGSGPLEGLVNDAISRYNLADSIVLYGAKTQDDIIKIMSSMDIFLYPGVNDMKTGRAENQGLVLQEAQSMELPVVTSNAGGIPDGVIDSETAFVLPEKDIPAFVDKLELLINDKELRLKMGKRGREYVTENFDYIKLGELLENYYHSMIGN